MVLLEEREHRWQPLADACLGRAAVVGRGGLELEIVEGRVLGPDVVAMAERARRPPSWPRSDTVPAPSSIVLTGRRLGEVVGVATRGKTERSAGRSRCAYWSEESSRRKGSAEPCSRLCHASVQRHGWAADGARGYGARRFLHQRQRMDPGNPTGCSVVTVATAVTPRPTTLEDGRASPALAAHPGGSPPRGPGAPWAWWSPALWLLPVSSAGSSPPEGLWLDEALSVNISKLPLAPTAGGAGPGRVATALLPCPPLLDAGLFGQGDFAVRALSGVISTATLPFLWAAGKRAGGPTDGVGSAPARGQLPLGDLFRDRHPHVLAHGAGVHPVVPGRAPGIGDA